MSAFDSRFQRTCCNRPGSTRTRSVADCLRTSQCDVLLRRRRRKHRNRVVDDSDRIQDLRAEAELPCQDPRQIEKVGNQLLLQLCRSINGATASATCFFSVDRWSTAVHPRMLASGLRSSCDNIARKSSFARVACSASSRAARSLLKSCSRSRSSIFRADMSAIITICVPLNGSRAMTQAISNRVPSGRSNTVSIQRPLSAGRLRQRIGGDHGNVRLLNSDSFAISSSREWPISEQKVALTSRNVPSAAAVAIPIGARSKTARSFASDA